MTSFAELMNSRDVQTLKDNLKQAGRSVELRDVFLKDFVKENQFTDAVKYVTYTHVIAFTVRSC